MKRIVICCDGTWNNPRKAKQTNVSKISKAIIDRRNPAEGVVQHVWYDEGVGNQGSFLGQLFAGATGYGLGENVRQAYRKIAKSYESGDDIYLFGFSRGAYTARSTLGMVRKCGLLKEPSDENLQRAWDFYKNSHHPNDKEARDFRSQYSVPALGTNDEFVPMAKFIGVWDTVGSLGIPIGRNRKRYEFHDVDLTQWVEYAYQALAVDEKRKDFAPTLWAQNADPTLVGHQTLEQVWFAGVHSDVGGGAAKEGKDDQSDRCLRWMIDRARACGLEFHEQQIEATVSKQTLGGLHLDLGLFGIVNFLRGTIERAIGEGVPAKKDGPSGPSYETVDPMVLKRQTTTRYRAPNVDEYWAKNQAARQAAEAALNAPVG